MRAIRLARCPHCGARLRSGRRLGDLCGPCERVGPEPRDRLPADFFDQEPIVAMLVGYDFGTFFATVRELTHWSQQTFGGVVGLEQSEISAIERGEHRLRNIQTIARLAQSLQIPPARLNFPNIRVTVNAAGKAGQKDVSWVDRRDFGQHIGAAVLGIAGAAGLDIDRLLALLPEAEPPGTRRVGVADVAVIEQFTAAFKQQDFTYGSGLIREAGVAQLQSVLPLLKAQVSSEARPRLMIAIAHLAMQVGWASFDVEQHDAARRLWMIALDLARHAKHPLGTDLTVYVLYDLALQALHLRRPDEALHLARLGQTAAVGRYPVSSSTLSALAGIQAQAYAAKRDGAGCDRTLGQAEEHFVAIDPANRPLWGAHFDATSLAARRGRTRYLQALAGREPQAASQAIPLLTQAVDHFGPSYTRAQGLYLPDLAGAYALAGDVHTAVSIGHQAIDVVTTLSSPRAHSELRTLHTVLEPLHPSPGVANLRARLANTAA